MPARTVPQRVTLLCRGVRVGVDLLAVLVEERAVNLISAPLELAGGGPPADVVIVDVPAEDRRAVCEEVRHHYRGPLVVLLHPGDNRHDLPPDRRRTLLIRPFSMRDLAVALAASGAAPPASDPAARLRLVPPTGAQDPGTDPAGDKGRTTVVHAVPRLVRSLGKRRMVRVSAILGAAALAFIVAFGLANQGGRCPPRCDGLIGADDLTASSSATTVQTVGVGPETVDSSVGVAGPTTTDPSGRPTALTGSRTDVATGGATRSSTTTSRSSGVPDPTSSPDPTRPQPSAPPTTVPTTTRPRPTTTTSATTTTVATTTTADPSASARRW
jgi:hypothetical protein